TYRTHRTSFAIEAVTERSSNPMKTCPSHEQLDQLVAGKLSAFDHAAVDAHVQSCTACQQTVTFMRRSETKTLAFRPTPSGAKIDVPPELINHPRYVVRKLLAVGGMGAVYAAEHRLLERPVVLKAIRPE